MVDVSGSWLLIGALMEAFVVGLMAWVLGMSASPAGKAPVSTMRVIDCDALKFGGDMETRFVRRDKKTGFWFQPVDEPTEQDTIVVQERYGAFGVRRRTLYWKRSSLLVIRGKNREWAIYRPEMLFRELEGKLEALAHLSGVQAEQMEELRYALADAVRSTTEKSTEHMEYTFKKVKELQPIIQKPTQRGR